MKNEKKDGFQLNLTSPEGRELLRHHENLYPDNKPRYNQVSWDINPRVGLMVGDEKCETYICAHPNPNSISQYLFEVPKGAQRFTCAFGMGLQVSLPTNHGNFTGAIILHTKLNTGETRSLAWTGHWDADSHKKRLMIDIKFDNFSPSQIELLVDSDGSNWCDQAVWIDPMLYGVFE